MTDDNKTVSGTADPATISIPLRIDLWGAKQIAAYLKVTPRQVLERYALLPGFPRAIRLPSISGKRGAPPRWKAWEIIKWVESFQERRPR